MLMLCAFITFSACSSSDDDPVNPVTNLVVPTSAKIGSEVTVQGSGFATGQTLFLQSESGKAVDVNAKMTSNGATFTVPYTMSEGKANVVLKSGSDSWTLGSMTLLAAENPVSAMTLPADMAIGKDVTIAGLGFAEGDKVLLLPIATTRMNVVVDNSIAGTVTSDGLMFTVPANYPEEYYEVVLVRGNSSWKLGETYVYQAKRIKNLKMENLYYGSLDLSFTYNTDGTLAKITDNSTDTPDTWTFSYAGNIVKVAVSDGSEMEFSLHDGRVVRSTAVDAYDDKEKYNSWTYDSQNRLMGITNRATTYQGVNVMTSYAESGNAESFDFGGNYKVTYDTNLKSVHGTIDVIFFINGIMNFAQKADAFIGLLLNKNAYGSVNLPATVSVEGQDYQTGESVWSTPYSLGTTFENNVLTMDFSDVLDMNVGFVGSKIVVTYEDL